ncbi:MAG TPA: gamma-glutamylcyclotransferase family protein [Caproicibacter sp.]|nr:gamma-glutamylcyclotransferase family protein [Caproicibacter sp.]
MENTTLYIAYGSNLNLEQMAHRCPTAKVAGASNLTGYQLRFRGGRHGAVATVEKKRGDSVPVLVWEITPADEATLDRYEGWPHLYRKETVRVRLNGKPVSSIIYIMNEGRPLGAPSPYYYNVIAEGYRATGFDINILKQSVSDSLKG